jgi:hypothetical protein
VQPGALDIAATVDPIDENILPGSPGVRVGADRINALDEAPNGAGRSVEGREHRGLLVHGDAVNMAIGQDT